MASPSVAVESLALAAVSGETQCPHPEEVAALLSRMAGPDARGGSGDIAELREEADALVVVVRRASGEVVGEKRVPASLGCSVRAEIAAVSIAALEAQLAGGEAPPLVVPSPPPAHPDAQAAAPAVVAVTRAPASPASAPLAVELGAAVLASFNGTDAAPAGRLEVALGIASTRWSVSLAATGVGPHSLELASGAGTWWRWGAELGLRRDVQLDGSTELQARAGVALTALAVRGSSFPTNAGDTLLDPGPVAALRFVSTGAVLRPWVEVSAAYWPRGHELSVRREASQVEVAKATMPRAEVFLGFGTTFGGVR